MCIHIVRKATAQLGLSLARPYPTLHKGVDFSKAFASTRGQLPVLPSRVAHVHTESSAHKMNSRYRVLVGGILAIPFAVQVLKGLPVKKDTELSNKPKLTDSFFNMLSTRDVW